MEFVNNKKVMADVAKQKDGNEFLGGQNPFGYFDEIQKSLDGSNTTVYDAFMDQAFQAAMVEYINGDVDEKTAYKNFYDMVKAEYPNLKQ